MFGSYGFGQGYFGQGPMLIVVVVLFPAIGDIIVRIPADDCVVMMPADDLVVLMPIDDEGVLL